jgi:inosine/xanthosine triphosphate pyrophosphatase family protein
MRCAARRARLRSALRAGRLRRTFAEMGNEQKNKLSHRGRALALAKENGAR